MIKIIVSGCFGKMGQKVCEIVSADKNCVVFAGIDIGEGKADFPVFKSFDDITEKGDVIIDFSHPSNLASLLNYSIKTFTPAVIATTGLSDEQKATIIKTSEKVPVFFSANMSLGINLLSSLAKTAASILGDGFDIEIVEKHHNKKIDAPSGTAILLADEISKSLSYSAEYVYDRHSVRKQRKKEEIGIHSVRGGTIVGDHDIIFAGNDEVITLSHSAYSKNVFANGAVNAAKFLVGKKQGLYDMNDLVKENIGK